MDVDEQSGARTHPGIATYVIVAAFLTLLTAMEVTVSYVHALRPVMVPVLLVLAAAKFALVVMFYMHLKFDRRAYGAVFLSELFFAAAVVFSLLMLFAAFPIRL